jgi:uncharacterized protein with von Willebrand factor type A (vWA) domain
MAVQDSLDLQSIAAAMLKRWILSPLRRLRRIFRSAKKLKGSEKRISRPLIIPPDNSLARFADVRRSNRLRMKGDDLVVNKIKRAAGALTIEEGDISEEEMAYARIQMRKIAQRLASSLSRNRRNSSARVQLDFRRSMRKSIQTGGIIIDPRYKKRMIKKQQLVIILDTSGSMQVWIKMLIQLIQAIGLELSKKELFIFAQDLECVTKDLKRTWQDTVKSLQDRANWGGTTNIHTALKTLQRDYHDRFSPQSIVLLLSDLFTSEPETSAEEVRKIARRTNRFFIFRAVDDEMDRETSETYYENYVIPFTGSAAAIFDIKDISSMAHAGKNVCIRR